MTSDLQSPYRYCIMCGTEGAHDCEYANSDADDDDGERDECDGCGESFNVAESGCEAHCLRCCTCQPLGWMEG
jgi:hypothetical protein